MPLLLLFVPPGLPVTCCCQYCCYHWCCHMGHSDGSYLCFTWSHLVHRLCHTKERWGEAGVVGASAMSTLSGLWVPLLQVGGGRCRVMDTSTAGETGCQALLLLLPSSLWLWASCLGSWSHVHYSPLATGFSGAMGSVVVSGHPGL